MAHDLSSHAGVVKLSAIYTTVARRELVNEISARSCVRFTEGWNAKLPMIMLVLPG
jgi:hypothetical protein